MGPRRGVHDIAIAVALQQHSVQLPPLADRLPMQILFGAMFAFADNFYNGPVATVAHAIMSATLTQVGAGSWWAGLWLCTCLGLSCTWVE